MEQNSDTSALIAPVAENNKQNGGSGLKITTAIACIVAVCGIGFGVYGMIQSSQKDNQISDLKGQINDLNEEVVVQPDDTIVDESYKTFADNLVKNNDIHIFDHNGTNSVLISVEGSHLTVSDLDENGSESVFAESDNIIGAYPVKIGNGSVPYVYLIKEDGSVARIDISDRGARVIENLDEFERIV